MTDRHLGLACALALTLVLGCPRARTGPDSPEALPPARTAIDPAFVTPVKSVTRLPDGEPVHDPDSGIRVPVPEGWSAYRSDQVPGLVVRLERAVPPAMRIEVHRGSDRVPDGGQRFFDRGPYLGNGRTGEVIGVWAERDPVRPDTWRFGVLLQHDGRSVVIEGWLPEEDFEAAKRSFDAVVEGTTFDEGGEP